MTEELVKQLAADLGGEITDMQRLPDGSGFATMSLPLPKDHWLTANPDDFNVPPMPFRVGTGQKLSVALTRDEMADRIWLAGKYAVRCATMNGKEMDFDPDALLQNLVVGMLGYWTENGLSSNEWANPKELS